MRIEGDIIRWSASDLTAASACEFGFLRELDEDQGRLPSTEQAPDAMLERTSELGAAHEQRILDAYREEHGDAVAVIERPDPERGITFEDAKLHTQEALASQAPVVAQAALELRTDTSRFIGYADFLVRTPEGTYRVEDTKLARSEKVQALLQLAAYAEALDAAGVPIDPTVSLVLGDGRRSDHKAADIAPVLHLRRDRLLTIVRERQLEGTQSGEPTQWGDDRYSICGACAHCETAIDETDDVLKVATLSRTQRERLHHAGIATVAQLAASTDPVPGIGRDTLARLRQQASLQIQATPGSPPPLEIADADSFRMIPPPSPGDIFFDFEGDPLYTEGAGAAWGLDYLWGWVNADGTFERLWAHDFAGEREALKAFLTFLEERLAQHPGMHVYHYAPYERSHLFAMAARWGIGEHAVDDLLREGVLVDLYPIVRRTLRVGSPSYSIKKLEPLYMGAEHREGVDNAGDSIVEYARACEARDAGDAEDFARRLADIEQYNAYDCRSTLKLRDWLLGLAAEHGITPHTSDAGVGLPTDASGGPSEAEKTADAGPSDLELALEARAEQAAPDDAVAYRIAAAAVDYHRRERKSFWHDHFARLTDPKEGWAETRDVFDVSGGEVIRAWFKEGRQRTLRRIVRLTGVPAPGSRFSDATPFALYDDAPYATDAEPGVRTAHPVTVVSEGDDWVEIEETQKHGATWDAIPTALTPGKPPATKSIENAIAAWGARVAAGESWPADPASDLLRRLPPRVTGSGLAPASDPDRVVGPLVDSLLRLDRSYLAVQGPPGTGKTYVGSHAVAALVREHGWKVGVVAQSHAVVEHMLDAIVEAGVPSERVGKALKDPEAPHTFTAISKDALAGFAADHPEGYVIGGTAWDLTNRKRVAEGQLDLLVVDEAGQFALADTIAAAQSALRLLLLGDPQQLPAVTQGVHPAPVDTPALEWLSAGHDVLPAEYGYFLAQSRRMDAAVAEPVSHLSYAGELSAHATTASRQLEGVEPGLVAVPVHHAGNATSSPEEAAEVVRIVSELIGTPWTDPGTGRERDPLTAADFIVVTPYNAQRGEVTAALRAAGLDDVRVGTVDKFQGQEAVIAIVSLAASSAADVPRGMEFLINRNRLNVAISRAKWAARLVYSPGLLGHMPSTPERLIELGRFARLAAPQDRQLEEA